MNGVGGGSGMSWVVVMGELSVWELFCVASNIWQPAYGKAYYH